MLGVVLSVPRWPRILWSAERRASSTSLIWGNVGDRDQARGGSSEYRQDLWDARIEAFLCHPLAGTRSRHPHDPGIVRDRHVDTTMIYTHVVNRALGVRSPLDELSSMLEMEAQ